MWLATAAAIACLLLLYVTLLLPGDVFTWLIREEHPIELAGATALVACAVFALVAWRRARSWAPLARLSLLALGLLFAFGAGEEISWGQRIFGVETPQEIREVNEQDEITLHNLEAFDGLLDVDRLFQLFWLVIGVIVPLAALHAGLRKRLRRLLPLLPAPLAIAFVFNQLLTWGTDALLEAEPALYNSTTFPVGHSIFEIKETGACLLLALGFWFVLRHAGGRDERARA